VEDRLAVGGNHLDRTVAELVHGVGCDSSERLADPGVQGTDRPHRDRRRGQRGVQIVDQPVGVGRRHRPDEPRRDHLTVQLEVHDRGVDRVEGRP